MIFMEFSTSFLLLILMIFFIEPSSQGFACFGCSSNEIPQSLVQKVDTGKLLAMHNGYRADWMKKGRKWKGHQNPGTVRDLLYSFNRNCKKGKFEITPDGDVHNSVTKTFLATRRDSLDGGPGRSNLKRVIQFGLIPPNYLSKNTL